MFLKSFFDILNTGWNFPKGIHENSDCDYDFEVPGVRLEDIKVQIKNGTLTVLAQNEKYVYTYELDDIPMTLINIKAILKDGILNIRWDDKNQTGVIGAANKKEVVKSVKVT